jgi:hypothetical protein
MLSFLSFLYRVGKALLECIAFIFLASCVMLVPCLLAGFGIWLLVTVCSPIIHLFQSI